MSSSLTATKAALIGIAFTLLSGSLSTVALVWNDSTAFILSAIETVRQGSLVLFSGVNAGYVLVISVVLAMGAGLNTLVAFQQVIWAISVGLGTLTVVKISKRPWLAFPMASLGGYPGIQMYGNVIMSESTFVCCVTNATCLLLLARRATSPNWRLTGSCGAIMFAMLAAVTKAQGASLLLLVAVTGIASVIDTGRWRFLAACSVAMLSLSVVAGAYLVRDTALDRTSRLFGAKTLFCAHLDIVEGSSAAEQLTKNTFGASANKILEMMRSMRRAAASPFPTLGFNADECQHNPAFDDLVVSAQNYGTDGVRAWYLDTFRAAVDEHPTQYAEKVLRQLVYGLKMSVPPHGLGQQWIGVQERRDIAARMLTGRAHSKELAQNPSEIQAGMLARVEPVGNYVLRAISLVSGIALVLSIAAMLWPAYRNSAGNAASGAAIAALVWWSQALVIATSHTLDVWRYLIPVVPAAIITTLLFACALSNMTRHVVSTVAASDMSNV